MERLTNGELIRRLRKPGKVYMPILAPDSVDHLPVEKWAIIELLNERRPNDLADWGYMRSGPDHWLDTPS